MQDLSPAFPPSGRCRITASTVSAARSSTGIDHSQGDAVVIMMADESDDCRDVVRYWELLGEGWDAVFGSRFVRGGGVIDYPAHKLLINRMANLFLRLLFRVPLNDFTNAFKAYRRKALDGCRPFLSPHFNLTVELPLKTIVRGYSWTVMPITWRNRRSGISKLKIREMGSRYLSSRSIAGWKNTSAAGTTTIDSMVGGAGFEPATFWV
jgi:glycosyltransferase involved in cell wall biosynthesis